MLCLHVQVAAALFGGAEFVRAQSCVGSCDGAEAVVAGVVRAEGFAALLDRAIGALGFPGEGESDGSEAVRAADGVTVCHVLRRVENGGGEHRTEPPGGGGG